MYVYPCMCVHTHTHIKRIIEKFKTHENKGRKLPIHTQKNANMEIYYKF